MTGNRAGPAARAGPRRTLATPECASLARLQTGAERGGPHVSLSPEEVRRIAHLARLSVTDEEVAANAGELSSILDFVNQMNAVDTSGVTPMAHPQHATQRLRPDVVTEPDRRDRYQAIAPAVERGLYLVPRVVE